MGLLLFCHQLALFFYTLSRLEAVSLQLLGLKVTVCLFVKLRNAFVYRIDRFGSDSPSFLLLLFLSARENLGQIVDFAPQNIRGRQKRAGIWHVIAFAFNQGFAFPSKEVLVAVLLLCFNGIELGKGQVCYRGNW